MIQIINNNISIEKKLGRSLKIIERKYAEENNNRKALYCYRKIYGKKMKNA